MLLTLLEEVRYCLGSCTRFDLDVERITDMCAELPNKVHQCCPVKIGTMPPIAVWVTIAVICGVW
jgi:hypothetical protein